jgi:hypothetical protein
MFNISSFALWACKSARVRLGSWLVIGAFFPNYSRLVYEQCEDRNFSPRRIDPGSFWSSALAATRPIQQQNRSVMLMKLMHVIRCFGEGET